MKMYRFSIIFCLLAGFACSRQDTGLIPSEIEPDVNLFVHYADIYGKKVKVHKLSFVLQGEFTENPTWSAYYQNKVVYFDTTSMHYRVNRRALVFHELGHALLGRDHNDKLLENGKSGSIMNILPSNFNPEDEYYDYYVRELFLF